MITEPKFIIFLECRKWGFKRWGVYANLRISEEKGLFPPFSGFPKCSSHPPEKGEKGGKRVKTADFGRFPGRAARHPLSPHLLHPHLRQPNIRIIFGNFCSMITQNNLFLELTGLGKKREQRITESLTELFWELCSVILVEELPHRNCFGIISVIFLCVMVFST